MNIKKKNCPALDKALGQELIKMRSVGVGLMFDKL